MLIASSTTTSQTAYWAQSAARILHTPSSSRPLEYAIRALFFILNMTFNGVMWGLFTRALALSPSAIRVNVINTASNFLITAFMGYLIFQEHLPPLWFLGAGMLVAGSVIIGGRDDGQASNTSEHNDSSEKTVDTTSPLRSQLGGTSTSMSKSRDEGRLEKRR